MKSPLADRRLIQGSHGGSGYLPCLFSEFQRTAWTNGTAPRNHFPRNRREAGLALARALGKYANRSDVLVLALPRGGVPVAFEVAVALGAPLDVFVVRKLGVPGHEELALGAIASGSVTVPRCGLRWRL